MTSEEYDEVSELLWDNLGNILTEELIETLLRLIYETRTGGKQ